MVWKQTGGGFLQMKDIFYTLLVLKSLDIFFIFNLHAMEITRCHIFKEKGHLFYIQSPCHANKQVMKFQR